MKTSNPEQEKYRILVVCSANKGRSASYHAHMQHLLNERGISHIEIDSAGFNEERIREFYETNDIGANPWIREILGKEGIGEIYAHQVKPVDEDLVRKSYIVLTFETSIRDGLKAKYPESSDHIYAMREYLGLNIPDQALDVDDAYKPRNGLYRGKIEPRTLKAFSKVSSESRRLAQRTLDKILEETQNEE
jgi:protein-tyrosine-phosphatase